MSLSRAWKIVAPLALLPVVLGCADVAYQERSALSHTRYAMVEDALPSTPRIAARRAPGADVVATRALLAPPAPAN